MARDRGFGSLCLRLVQCRSRPAATNLNHPVPYVSPLQTDGFGGPWDEDWSPRYNTPVELAQIQDRLFE